MSITLVALSCFTRRMLARSGVTDRSIALSPRVEPIAIALYCLASWLTHPFADSTFGSVLLVVVSAELAEALETILTYYHPDIRDTAATDGALVGLCLTIVYGRPLDLFVVLAFRMLELVGLTIGRALAPGA